ncbi:MAG: hypothetical protein ABF649_00750 [Bacillus sp. (in: firmicutes)]
MGRYEANHSWIQNIDEEYIITLYTKDNMSLTAISKLLGYDRGTVKRRLEKNGVDIVRKPRSDKSKDNSPAIRKVYYKYGLQAERRGYNFDIPYEFFTYLTSQKCHYCGNKPLSKEITRSGHVYVFNGLDRIDNNKHYTLDNVIPCCKICNQMKSNLEHHVFIEQVRKIYLKYQQEL